MKNGRSRRLRCENLAIQRNQFDAEKKVAVADTSIQNLQQALNGWKKKGSSE